MTGDQRHVAPPVRLRVLGRPVIEGVPEDHHVRPQSLEFLTYLVVRGGSAWQEDIFDDLMPEPSRRLAAQRLHTYTYNLRRTFALVGGERPYLRLKRHQYVLDRDAFDVDLWTFRDALAEAEMDAGAVYRAITAYGGPLAAGTRYLWIERYRESARRAYVDAVVALAKNLSGRPDKAERVLNEALRHYPDDSELLDALARVRR
ncbi:AfsR/SARP family transcriptional regulator [Dactylosporangium sp. CA-139114]|uniref:AfsR/SARP family transcriptional regulator n=1 Tax=Dactylosporangium sp. CA-139114 TaxID=3239931 RepID=UPI003D9962E2